MLIFDQYSRLDFNPEDLLARMWLRESTFTKHLIHYKELKSDVILKKTHSTCICMKYFPKFFLSYIFSLYNTCLFFIMNFLLFFNCLVVYVSNEYISYLKNHSKHKCICYTYQHCYGNLIEWKNLKSVLMTP